MGLRSFSFDSRDKKIQDRVKVKQLIKFHFPRKKMKSEFSRLSRGKITK